MPELSWTGDFIGNKKKRLYISRKRLNKECVELLLNENDDSLLMETDKTKELSVTFPSVFNCEEDFIFLCPWKPRLYLYIHE